jgi:hypothetical protein
MKIKLIGILVLIGTLSGCDDYLDINKDPNNPTTVPITGLMSTVTLRTGNNLQRVGDFTSYFVQYLAGPNADGETDTHKEVPYDNAWYNIYHLLSDVSDLEKLAAEQGATHYVGVAKVVKAINLALAIDVWGDIPYTEAFFAQTLKPAYDDDEVLYDEVFKLLADGVTALESTENTVELGDDDFIFHGDVDLWIKTAYALRARYLNHLSKSPDYDPDAILAAVANGFANGTENAKVDYFDTDINPWGSVALDQAGLILDGWISQQVVDAMNGTTFGVVDPRMPFMYSITEFGTYIGTENGAGRGAADVQGERSVLVVDTYYADQLSPILVITHAEQKFIEAEAYMSKNMKTEAYAAYLAGIASHMNLIGVDPTDRDAYLANGVVAVGSANITLGLIMKEKYVAMFLNPEAWNDARRYDYQYTAMTVPVGQNPDLGGEFIRRVIYPQSETSRNGSNVPEVDLLDVIWWDQN